MPRWALLGGFALLAVAGIGGLVASTADPASDATTTPGPWFFVAYFAILLFNGVIFLVAAALELALLDDELIWQAPLRSGGVRTDDLRSVRPLGPFGVLAVVGTATGPRTLVWATAGFADFMEAVVAAAPHVEVRHGSYQRTGDWLAGRPRRSKSYPSPADDQ